MAGASTRAEVADAAAKLAADLRDFMERADQFVSLSRRYALTNAVLDLEALADGR